MLQCRYSIGCFAQINNYERRSIARSEREWTEASLAELVNTISYDNSAVAEQFIVQADALGNEKKQTVYPLTLNKQWQGVVLSAVAPDGYSGEIEEFV